MNWTYTSFLFLKMAIYLKENFFFYILGMILELGKENVKVLLQDQKKLQLAVDKARLAIDSSEREFIGEMLYQKIETVYPKHVEKITGKSCHKFILQQSMSQEHWQYVH